VASGQYTANRFLSVLSRFSAKESYGNAIWELKLDFRGLIEEYKRTAIDMSLVATATARTGSWTRTHSASCGRFLGQQYVRRLRHSSEMSSGSVY